MNLLPVAAALDCGHQQVFRCDERKIVCDELRNDLLVDAQTCRHVLHQAENAVYGEEALREGNAAVGRVVQRSLEPLRGGRHRRVQRVSHHVAGQGADPLAAHRVALVGHRRGANLCRLERLFKLPVML